MSEFDLSQVDQDQTDFAEFQEDRPVGRMSQKAQAARALVLKEDTVNPAEASAILYHGDAQRTIQEQMSIRGQESADAITQLLRQRMAGAPSTTPIEEAVDVAEIEAVVPDKVEREVVRTLDNGEGNPTQETARLYAQSKIAELLDRQGVGDVIADTLGFFVPFNLTADLSDLEGSSFTWTDSVDVDSMIVDYQALSPEEKMAAFPGLMEAVLDATGTTIAGVEVSDQNVQKAAMILATFLDPQGEERIVGEEALDIGFGLLDVGAVGATTKAVKTARGLMGTAAKSLSDKTNTARVAAGLGNRSEAAKISIAAAQSPAVSDAHNVSRMTAAANASPVDRSMFDLTQAPEINNHISASLNEFVRQADELTRRIQDDQLLLRAGALNDFEKQNFIQTWEQKLNKNVSDVFNDEVHVVNLRIGNVTEDGFEATYDLKHINQPSTQKLAGLRRRRLNLERQLENGEDVQDELNSVIEQLRVAKEAAPSRENAFVKFTVDENGNFNYTAEHSSEAARALGSPSFWSYTKQGGDFNDSFKTAGVTTDLEAAFSRNLEQMVNEAWKPVSGALQSGQRKNVEDVLLAGDVFMNENGTRGTVYSVNELIAGVDVGNRIVRLTKPNEIEAYYRMRAVADNFWRLENHAARRRLELNGFTKALHLDQDEFVALRTLDSAGNAKQSVRNRSARTGNAAYDSNSGDVIEITDEVIDEQYALGNVLARTSESKAIKKIDGEAEYVDYVFVNQANIEDLPYQITHFKRGYVPKINKGIEYLVKESYPVAKRGARDALQQKTLRFFASKKDAERFAEMQALKAVDDGRYATIEQAREAITAVADHELTPMQRIHEPIGASGGLFSGPRSSDDILTGLSGAYTERVGPYEAMSRNARHLGSLVARNEARIGDEQRWLNTVDAFKIENNGFLNTKLGTDATGRTLEAMRQQIKAWNGVPQMDETAFQGLVQNLHDWTLEGARKLPGLQNVDSIKPILWLKHTDLAAAIKSATMHAVLGVLSPAQLLVQASAMSVAITRYPRLAPQMISYGFRMGMADMFKDTKSLRALTKHFDDVDDTTPLFSELYRAWERSGLRESVRSNADLVASENYGYMTARTIQRLGDASLLLYRQGELMNRRAAFITSFLAKKKQLGGKVLSDSDLLAVRKDANLTMLELNQANRAWWQGGPQTGTIRQMFGVMTQFQQVAAKSLELMFKGSRRGGFTAAEKTRILAGQFALFGAAGVPLVGQLLSEVAQWSGETMDQDTVNQWNQGLLIGSLLNAMEMDVDVANRVSALGQINQFFKDLLFDDVPMIEKFFGVGFDVGSRTLDSIKKLRPLMMSVYQNREMSELDFRIAVSAMAQIPSSTRNMAKAWVMHNAHVIRDKHGNAVHRSNYNLATELGVAFGMRPSVESETRILQMTNKDYDDLVTDISDTYIWLANQYIDAVENGDRETTATAARQLETVMTTIASSTADNPIIMNRVYDRVQRKLELGESLRDRALSDYLNRTLPDEVFEGAVADRRKIFGRLGTDTAIISPMARELEQQRREEE